jgi:hypothetical protein
MIDQTISYYRIVERLRSGMGVVYKAEDIRLHLLTHGSFCPRAWLKAHRL